MEKEKFHLIIDMGHGENCAGKRAPDKSFYEWEFNRAIGFEVGARLTRMGYNVHYTWTENHEPLSIAGRQCTSNELKKALNWRARKVNEYCDKYGTQNCASVSIHANASDKHDEHGWSTARGFCAMVGKTASAKSKKFAQLVYAEAQKAGLQGNRSVPSEHYWVQGLAMCDSTKCPAILTESLFYDNKTDLEILKSKEGREKIVQLHVNGIVNYIAQL